MSSPRLQRKRKPGRPNVHGGHQLLARLRKKKDHRFGGEQTHNAIAYFLACVLAPSAPNGDVEPKRITKEQAEQALDKLDPMLRVRVLAAADAGAVYYRMREYVFRQPDFIGPDGELLPVLRKSFLGWGRDWRRELKAFDLELAEFEEQVPTLAQYIAARSNPPADAPARENGTPDAPGAATSTDRGPGEGEAA